MKETTVHSLVVARTLLERAEPLCTSEDRHLASAGLVVLQDALEVVLYALLIELDIDDAKSIEKKSFDELLGELKAAKVVVPKSGTLKALNKQRVLAKHYAQLAEPAMVRNYFSAARTSIESMTKSVLDISIQDLFISDLLSESESKKYLKNAEMSVQKGDYLEALTCIRKAIYIEFEDAYSVGGWKDYEPSKREGLIFTAFRGGWKAPSWSRNREWIEKNVKVPTDYIQIDQQTLRLDAMEMGIHTMELQNLQRLTPKVFRQSHQSEWSVTYDAGFPASNATEHNARYCLDRAVWIVLKKQEHARVRREPAKEMAFDPPPIYIGRVLFDRPSTQSKQLHIVSEDYKYTIERVVGGFDPMEKFYELVAESEEQSTETLLGGPLYFYKGYLQILPEDG